MQGKSGVEHIDRSRRKKPTVERSWDPSSIVGSLLLVDRRQGFLQTIARQWRKELEEGVEIVAREVREVDMEFWCLVAKRLVHLGHMLNYDVHVEQCIRPARATEVCDGERKLRRERRKLHGVECFLQEVKHGPGMTCLHALQLTILLRALLLLLLPSSSCFL